MRIPRTLERFVSQVDAKLGEFDARLTSDDIFRWVLQFDQADQSLAVKLFLNITYFTAGNVAELCKLLFSQLPSSVRAGLDNTRFVGLGAPSDSGSMLTYHYRVNNRLQEVNFLTTDVLRDQLRLPSGSRTRRWNLVFIDDFIGTGGQATEMLSRELKELLSIGSFDYVGLHALAGFSDGRDRIKAATSIDVRVAHLLTSKDRAFHEASDMLSQEQSEKERIRHVVEQYGTRLYPRGPLGYGSTQALVSFFYNTPNNTLPVIWASTDGWQPLLPRLEGEINDKVSENEKLLLTYLAGVGGQSAISDLLRVGAGLSLSMDSTIDVLIKRHIARMIDDDDAQYLQLTAKGDREALALFEEERTQSVERLEQCGRLFSETLPRKPRSSQASFDQLRARKNEVVSLVSTACKLGDVSTVRTLRRWASWVLLMEHAYEERIRLGELILRSFSKESLGGEWGWTMVDDLGWSFVALGMLDRARQYIEQGIDALWLSADVRGACQGLRHLQAIKVRKGDYSGAMFGLRLVFGVACSIPDVEARLEMQAGVLRALANACQRQGQSDARRRYYELSELLSLQSGQQIHASSDARRMDLGAVLSETVRSEGEAALLLLRHPITAKNQKRVFGRHLQDSIPQVGVAQIAEVATKVRASVGGLTRTNARLYSAPAKGASVLAQRVAEECGWEVHTDASLASIDAGEFTGLSEEDAPEYYPDLMTKLIEYRQNLRDGFELEFPRGESFRMLCMRVGRFLIQTAYADVIPELCVIVAHASSITAMLNILQAIDRSPGDSWHRYYEVPPASITMVTFDALHGNLSLVPEYVPNEC